MKIIKLINYNNNKMFLFMLMKWKFKKKKRHNIPFLFCSLLKVLSKTIPS